MRKSAPRALTRAMEDEYCARAGAGGAVRQLLERQRFDRRLPATAGPGFAPDRPRHHRVRRDFTEPPAADAALLEAPAPDGASAGAWRVDAGVRGPCDRPGLPRPPASFPGQERRRSTPTGGTEALWTLSPHGASAGRGHHLRPSWPSRSPRPSRPLDRPPSAAAAAGLGRTRSTATGPLSRTISDLDPPAAPGRAARRHDRVERGPMQAMVGDARTRDAITASAPSRARPVRGPRPAPDRPARARPETAWRPRAPPRPGNAHPSPGRPSRVGKTSSGRPPAAASRRRRRPAAATDGNARDQHPAAVTTKPSAATRRP